MWQVETKFAVHLGGNTFINTPNLVVYKGAPVFTIRRSDSDGMLGIDFNVFDFAGRRIATVVKGIVVQGDQANYLIETGHQTYTVSERFSGRVITRVQRRDVKGAELDVNVHMYLPNGFLLDAGPDAINLPGATLSRNTIVGGRAGISIT